MEMKTVHIGDLYTVSNGLSKGKEFFGSGYPFLTFSEVMNNFFVPETLCSLVQTEISERSKFSIRRGDVFLNRTSETPDELGITCVALKDYPEATFNGFCKRLRPKSDDVVPEFIGYYLRSVKFRNEMKGLTGSMITRASLRNEQLTAIQIDLPSKDIQLKIANTLRQYDLLIYNCKKQIALLEEAAQRLYREWFVDLRFPGHETTPIGEDGLHEGWKMSNINAEMTFQRGYDLPKNKFEPGCYPVVGSTSFLGYHNQMKVAGPGIVTGRSGSLGKFQFIYDNFWPHNTSLFLKDLKGHNIYFLHQLLITQDFTKLNSGGAIPSLNRNTLAGISIKVPTSEIENLFGLVVSEYYKLIQVISKMLNNALTLKMRLLPRLISGQIEIE